MAIADTCRTGCSFGLKELYHFWVKFEAPRPCVELCPVLPSNRANGSYSRSLILTPMCSPQRMKLQRGERHIWELESAQRSQQNLYGSSWALPWPRCSRLSWLMPWSAFTGFLTAARLAHVVGNGHGTCALVHRSRADCDGPRPVRGCNECDQHFRVPHGR